MAKRVADIWLRNHAEPEYRLTVYRGYSREARNLPGLLRSFRDGKTRFAGLKPVSDLGIKMAFDHLTLWSRDQQGLQHLETALQKMGCETSGVF